LADRQASGHQNLDLASFIVGQLAVALAHDSSPLCLTWRLSSARWPFATRRRPTGCCTSEWNWGFLYLLFAMPSIRLISHRFSSVLTNPLQAKYKPF
ncbi:MAG: hypothetical protein OXF20_03645, partial [Gammaproteobacteria bacterium]|nr:hypothetical protein [Gammaproteobacteria bacterium]